MNYRLIFATVIGLLSCQSEKKNSLFVLEENTGIVFNNRVVDQKYENSFFFRNYYNGGGVAIGDINNDQLPDILLSSNMGENKRYLNKGNFQFADITAASGMQQDSMWSTGATFADINADGWPDVFVANDSYERDYLYINKRNGTFTDAAETWTDQLSFSSMGADIADVNNDGYNDLFTTYMLPPLFGRLDAGRYLVLLNGGKGELADMSSRESGLNLRGSVKGIRMLQTKQGRRLLFTVNNEVPVLMKLNTWK